MKNRKNSRRVLLIALVAALGIVLFLGPISAYFVDRDQTNDLLYIKEKGQAAAQIKYVYDLDDCKTYLGLSAEEIAALAPIGDMATVRASRAVNRDGTDAPWKINAETPVPVASPRDETLTVEKDGQRVELPVIKRTITVSGRDVEVCFAPDYEEVSMDFNAAPEGTASVANGDAEFPVDGNLFYVTPKWAPDPCDVVTVTYHPLSDVKAAKVQYLFTAEAEERYPELLGQHAAEDASVLAVRQRETWTGEWSQWTADPETVSSPEVTRTLTIPGSDIQVEVNFFVDYNSVSLNFNEKSAAAVSTENGKNGENTFFVENGSTFFVENGDTVTVLYWPQIEFATATVEYRFGEKSVMNALNGAVLFDLRGQSVPEDFAPTQTVTAYRVNQSTGDWKIIPPAEFETPELKMAVKVGDVQQNSFSFFFGERTKADKERQIEFFPDMEKVAVAAMPASGSVEADEYTEVYENGKLSGKLSTAHNILSKSDGKGENEKDFDFSVLNGALITVFYDPEPITEEYILETGNALLTHLSQLMNRNGAIRNVVFDVYTKYPQFKDQFESNSGVAVAVDATGLLTYDESGKVVAYKDGARSKLTSTAANDYSIQLFYENGTAYVLTKERMIANPDSSQMFGSKQSFGGIDLNLGWNGNNNVSMSVRNITFNSWNVDEPAWEISNGFGFDTVLVEELDYMFSNMQGYDGGLETLDLSAWINGLPNARTTEDMFYGCQQLRTLTLGNTTFQTTGNLKYVSGMFMGCEKLTSLNLEAMDLSGVRSVCEGEHNYEQEGMFENCHALISIGATAWNTSGITDLRDMFRCCWNLGELDLSGWDVSNVTTMANMFNMSAVDGDPDNAFIKYGPATLNLTGWNTASLTDTYRMFSGCNKTSEIIGIGDLNTANVTTMHGMFQNAGVTEMDLSKWNVSNVATTENMFRGCEKLATLNLSGWNTAELTNIGNNASSTMFWNCNALTDLDVSGWMNTKLTSIEGLFNGLTWLKTLNVENFNTAGVTNMGQLFHGCSHLTSIDLSTWNTSNVTNMFAMFRNTLRLENVDLTGSFSTANVTNMREMFCITTDGVRTTEVLDLRNFDTKSVTDMYMMFSGQNKLKTIYATDAFVAPKENNKSMFDQCAVLAGGYNMTSPVGNFGNRKNSTDGTYAKVDREGQEGYFTEPRPEGDIPVTGVSIAYGEDVEKSGNGKIKMGVGGTLQLRAVIEPEDATNQKVTWASSDNSIATVDEGGVVTCVGTGVNPTITVTTQDGRYTANVSFYPYQANLYRPKAIRLINESGEETSGGEIDLTQGDTETLSGVLSPLGSSYTGAWTWTSSNETVATVENGVITALNPGAATITASISWGTGKNDTKAVTSVIHVYGDKEVTGLSLDKSKLNLSFADGVPQTEKLTATLAPTDAKKTELSWASSNESVAAVDSKGNVTSVGVGTATITVSGAGFTAGCEVTVSRYVALEGVTISYGDTVQTSGKKLKIGVGGTIQLTANVEPENASVASVSWSSNSVSNVSVDTKTGLITGVKTGGNATIKVTVIDSNGVTKTAEVIVSPDTARNCVVTGVSLDKSSLELVAGESGSLSYTLNPEGYTTYGGGISWSSSDESVATVENGVITAIGPGEATITVTATTQPYSKVNKYTASCTVVVKEPAVVEEPLAAPSKIAAASIVPSLEGASYTIYYFKDEGSTEEIEAAAHVGDPEDESIRSFAIRGYDGLSREGYECVGWTNADETLLVTAGQAYVFEASAEDAVLYLWPVWRENSADASSAPTMESDFTGQGVTDNDALAEDGGQTGQVQGETSSDESITAGTLEEIDDEWPPTAAGPDSAGSDAGGTLSIGVISVGFVAMFLLGLLAKLAH